MLAAIGRTTLLDDVQGADPTTQRLEALAASLLGHEAGLLVLSGTMGNQLALRAHLGAPPHSVVADARSHLLGWEAGGLASLSGALAIPVHPQGDPRHLTLADVRRAAVLDDDLHYAPTKLVALENTLHGAVLPLAACRDICAWARAHGVKTHLDGARLWEAVAAQAAHGEHGGSLAAGMRAYGACFDSATVCFSKGLGAPLGSVLVGSAAFVRRARHVRKSVGGGMRQTGVIAAPAMTAVQETFFGGKLARGHALAVTVGKMWEAKGGRLVTPVETNMVWLDLEKGTEEDRKREQAQLMRAAETEGIQVYGGGKCRIVCHYQISDAAVERLGRVMDSILSPTAIDTSSIRNGVDESEVENGSPSEACKNTFKGYG